MEDSPEASVRNANGNIYINVSGSWSIEEPLPALTDKVIEKLESAPVSTRVYIGAENLGSWDSALLVFLYEIGRVAKRRKIEVDLNLPQGLTRLVGMAFAVPPRKGANRIK
ncbi:MAG: hypothetical protein K2H64_03085, partial [Desulfovibrio sp.]|nr:hypothetical protein [Desulfovibrio sp.]